MLIVKRNRLVHLMVLLAWWMMGAGTCLAADAADASGGLSGDRDSKPAPQAEVLDIFTACRAALRDNPSLAAAHARVQQARQRLEQAASGYWPRLDASGSGARVELSDTKYAVNLATARLFNPYAQVDNPDEVYSAGLRLSYVLFNGFERKFNRLAARYGVDASEASRRDVERLLLSAVGGTFHSAQLARENIAIAKADERFNRRLLEDAKARRRVGTGSLSDELNFEIRVNAARTERIRAEREFASTLHALAALMGIPGAQLPPERRLAPLTADFLADLKAPDVESLIVYAADNRPDLDRNRASIEQAQARVDAARAPYYPTLNLVAGLEGERYGSLEADGDDFGNSIALTLNYNLFAGGLYRAQFREAQQRHFEVQKTYENLQNTVSADIRSAADRVSAAQRQLKLQRENTQLVQRTRDLVEKEYAAGQTSLVRLNEAQRDLVTARSRLALALASLRQAWVDLEAETGHIAALFVDGEPLLTGGGGAQ